MYSSELGGMVVDRDLVVPARDGVGLATDVYRPAGDGPYPVLLERTPYAMVSWIAVKVPPHNQSSSFRFG